MATLLCPFYLVWLQIDQCKGEGGGAKEDIFVVKTGGMAESHETEIGKEEKGRKGIKNRISRDDFLYDCF